MMKFPKWVLLPSVLFSICASTSAFAGEEPWREEKGTHFIVHYLQNESFAKEILRKAENYYVSIAEELGYPRYSDFWQWDKRVQIYVYADKDAYLQASGQAEWSNGMADYVKKKIITYSDSENFLEALLPHEIAHLIFRDFVGFQGQVPLWLDEGVAQWQEPGKRLWAKPTALAMIQKLAVIPLRNLTGMNDLGREDPLQVPYFYAESVSLVDFMVKKYGTQSFTVFCRQLRDGKRLDEALRSAYPGSIQDLDDLQERWIRYVTEQ